MNNNTQIKLEELKFIKQQEGLINNKIHIISVITGMILVAFSFFFFINFSKVQMVEKIWFFTCFSLSFLILIVIQFPKIFFLFKTKNRIIDKLPQEHNLFKKDYQGWDANFNDSLDFQIQWSRQILKAKTLAFRIVILTEPCFFLAIIVLFIMRIK